MNKTKIIVIAFTLFVLLFLSSGYLMELSKEKGTQKVGNSVECQDVNNNIIQGVMCTETHIEKDKKYSYPAAIGIILAIILYIVTMILLMRDDEF